jgi:hypothetical protein
MPYTTMMLFLSRRALRNAITALAALGAGCVTGGQTGDEPYPALACRVAAESELELSEESPLGFSAEAMLAVVSGEHTASFRWYEERYEAPFTWPLGTETTLRMRVSAAESSARLQTRQAVETEGHECPDLLSTRVLIDFETDDGWLSGQAAGFVTSESGDPVYLDAEVAVEQAGGELASSVQQEARATLRIRAVYTPYGAHGVLELDYRVGSERHYAHLGDFPVHQDDEFCDVPASLSDRLIERLHAPAPVMLTFSDGRERAATLSTMATSDICYKPAGREGSSSPAMLVSDGVLSFASEGESYPDVRVSVHAELLADEQLGTITLKGRECVVPRPMSELLDRCGDFGFAAIEKLGSRQLDLELDPDSSVSGLLLEFAGSKSTDLTTERSISVEPMR